MPGLDDVRDLIESEYAEHAEAQGVPGYVAGVYHDGTQVLDADGCANLATVRARPHRPGRACHDVRLMVREEHV